MRTHPEHPAKFTQVIIDEFRRILDEEAMRPRVGPLRLLDPFAGTGRIHALHQHDRITTTGVEIEQEWADSHVRTEQGDALDTMFETGYFDVIATSPTYGNRMADHHVAKDDSKRMTYTHQLGHPLHENNSGKMQWGDKYKEFHEAAWIEATRVLAPGGLFVLNLKNFYRTRTVKGTRVTEQVDITQWHLDTLIGLGYHVEQDIVVPVRGMRMGQNYKKRVAHEMVYALRRDT